MAESVSEIVQLTRWLHEISYADIRRGEALQTVPVTYGRKKKVLRGVLLAPDLVLGRDRKFYKLMGDHALKMPLHLVCEQYNLKQLFEGYEKAKRTQPRSNSA